MAKIIPRTDEQTAYDFEGKETSLSKNQLTLLYDKSKRDIYCLRVFDGYFFNGL